MRERFDTIQALALNGMSKSAIARALGLDRHTVQKYLSYDVAPVRRSTVRGARILTPYEPYLLERSKQGAYNAMGL
jgi:transposase